MKYHRKFSALMIATIAFILLIFKFWLAFFLVQSASMENSLYSGDLVIVNKLHNLNFIENADVSEFIDSVRFNFKRGDVVVFKNVENSNELLIKRCIGLPGERISIENTIAKINNVELLHPDTYKFCKFFSVLDIVRFCDFEKRERINTRFDEKSKKHVAFLSKMEIAKLECDSIVQFDYYQKSRKLNSEYFGGFVDSLDTVRIPFSGLQVILNEETYALYKELFKKFENSDILEKKDGYYLDGKRIFHYRFKNNYFFAIGDNWDFSIDSRYFGFVPENYIIGKVLISIPFGRK